MLSSACVEILPEIPGVPPGLPDQTDWRNFLDQLPSMAFVEREGYVLACNSAAREVCGIAAQGEFLLERMLLRKLPADAGEARQGIDNLLRRSDGRTMPVSGVSGPITYDGAPARLLVLLEKSGGELKDSLGEATFLERLLDSAPDAMAIIERGRTIHINKQFSRLFGYSREAGMGSLLDDLVLPDGLQHESEILLHTVQAHGRASLDTVRRTRTGEYVDVSVLITPVDDGGETDGLFVIYRDIRQQKAAEARWQHTALHDALTGLANRRLFLERVRLTMARLKRRPDRNFAILFLDIDRFKKVNDTLGHGAGDMRLLDITTRLRSCLRPQDTIARFGGDEFAMLLDEVESADDVTRVAERIQVEVVRSGNEAASGIGVSASMGIALSSTRYTSAEEILRDADAAMYKAKAGGKARHEIFNPQAAGGEGR